MKNKPLYLQLTILFSALIVFVGLVFLTVIPATLKSFFTDETYRTIEESQLSFEVQYNQRPYEQRPGGGHMGGSHRMGGGMMGGMGGMGHMMHQNVRSAEHLFIDNDGVVLQGGAFSPDLLKLFYDQAINQRQDSERYQLDMDDQVMLYVIKKQSTDIKDVYQISYMWDTYQKELTGTLFNKMSLILVGVLLVGLLLAILFSKWIVKPIEYMKNAVAKITRKNWDEPISLNRTDELGELASSIDYMRVKLKEQDESEKSLLQQISHDLKTPVMVIRSYAEALRDEIYPTGSLQGTAEVIDKEAKNLEKKIKDLLLITKLDYLEDTKLTIERVKISAMLENVISRLHPYRPEISIEKNIEPYTIDGNNEQLTILLENLLDNALKYADKQIILNSYQKGNYYVIKCANDGQLIEAEVIEKAFQPFVKGEQGNFGLGLTIMKRIANLHEGIIDLHAENDMTVVTIKLANTII